MQNIYEVKVSNGWDMHSGSRTVAFVTDHAEANKVAARYGQDGYVVSGIVYDTDAEWAEANVQVVPAKEILP